MKSSRNGKRWKHNVLSYYIIQIQTFITCKFIWWLLLTHFIQIFMLSIHTYSLFFFLYKITLFWALAQNKSKLKSKWKTTRIRMHTRVKFSIIWAKISMRKFFFSKILDVLLKVFCSLPLRIDPKKITFTSIIKHYETKTNVHFN